MAPGPITTVVVGKGSDEAHAGALVALGHGLVEFPLMVGLLYGLDHLVTVAGVKLAIGIVGGLMLVWMGVGMIRDMHQDKLQGQDVARSPVMAGVLLSLGNPYFLVWWATVGAALILRAVDYGLVAFLAFGLLHWLCDLVWNDFLSILSYKGGEFFGRRFQRGVFLLCGGLLVFYGGQLLVETLTAII
jgi:threonine/homoserine/homoserine lactone efflux protein